MASTAVPAPTFSRSFNGAGFALGFGLGGFFDGILLHQVLQWHHLLSGLEAARADIRMLILADGAFHLLMYVVVGAGLWLLWKSRAEFPAPGSGRRLVAIGMLGFGTWHIVDAVLSHWVLGIHRIRMDVDNPLVWDLLWLAVFGIIPLVAGLLLRRSRGGGPPAAPFVAPLVVAVLASGAVSALPPPGDSAAMVLFQPGVTPQEAFAALTALDATLLWSDPTDQLWAVQMNEGASPAAFYGHGAMLVSNSILPAGCLDWLRV